MSEFRITQEQMDILNKAKKSAAKSRPARPQPKRFAMLPYPEVLQAAAAVNDPVLAVLAYLAYETWRQNTNTVLVPSRRLLEAGFSRSAKSRALHRLQQAGLVHLHHRPNRNPRVTLRWPVSQI
jgi:hypothetical protein